MRRSQLVFVTAVFTAFLTGFFVTRSRSEKMDVTDFPELPPPVLFGEIEPPEGFFPLEGQVLRAAGLPAPDVKVVLVSEALGTGEARPLPLTFTDAEGRFRLEDLLDGDYEAILFAANHPSHRTVVHIPRREPVLWTLPAPREPLPVLPDMARGPLEGRLSPPVGFERRFSPVVGYEISFLPAADEDPLSGAVKRTVETDAEGMFVLPDLAEADYEVHVLPPWARGGSWPTLEEPGLRFAHRASPDAAQSLSLRLRSGEITGLIEGQDGRPIEGALVSLHPSEHPDRVWPLATTDTNGYFRIRDLPPQSYLVEVRAGGDRVQRAVTVFVGNRERLELVLDPR